MDWGGESCPAETLVVSENGALVLAPEALLPGLILDLENRSTGATAPVRVVSCSRETDPFGFWQVGVGLLSPRPGFFQLPEVSPSPRGRERRRSRRVSLVHPVELVGDREAVRGRTREVSRHGALVLSLRDCPSGQPLWLRNLVSGRVRPARVVRSGPAAGVPGVGFDVAVEFDEPPRDFWGPEYDA